MNSEVIQVCSRIGELAKVHGGVRELSRQCGLQESSVSRWTRNQTAPSLSGIIALSQHCDVSMDWLLLGHGSMNPNDSSDEQLVIPYFQIEASAGPGRIAEGSTHADGEVMLPLGVIPLSGRERIGDLCALRAQGDSMEPGILKGSLLIVRRRETVKEEGIYVLVRGDTVIVKRLQWRGKRVLRLLSDNERYEKEDVRLDDPHESLRIIGEVIWVGAAA